MTVKTDYIRKLQIALELRKRENQKQDLSQFLKTVSPDFVWDKPHLKLIIEKLEAVAHGDLKRLIIDCPPRHGKSALATVRFPIYYFEKNPTHKIVVAGHTVGLVEEFSLESKSFLSNRIIDISKTRNRATEWYLEEGGKYFGVGVGGGISGRGANLMIIDDPIKFAVDCYSPTFREKCGRWYRMDVRKRLEPDAAIILIMTRWHTDDLAGKILDSPEKDKWEKIHLPALAEENDVLGRTKGEALWSERFNKEYLLEERSIDPEGFQALYQGNPVREGGNLFKIDNIQHYNKDSLPDGFKLCSIDTANDNEETSAYTSFTIWLYNKHRFYLVEAYKARLDSDQQTQQAIFMGNFYKINMMLVEGRSTGAQVAKFVRSKINNAFSVVIVEPAGLSKPLRAQCVKHLFRNGNIFIPEEKTEWLEDYIKEIMAFPLGKYCDHVDSTTQALAWLQNRFGYELQPRVEIKPVQKMERWRFTDGYK